jgi:hypothetical protein
LRRKLDSLVTLEKGIGPNATLQDALEFLSDRYDVTFIIDQQAFDQGGVAKAEETPVQLPRIAGLRLRTVLRLLLGQVKGDNQAGTFRIKGDWIEIMPGEPEATDADEPSLPRSWQRRLLRPIRWTSDLPRETNLPAALEILRARYGEKFTIDDKAFQTAGWPAPREMFVPGLKLLGIEGKGKGIDADLALVDILEWWARYFGDPRQDLLSYQMKPDAIEITVVKRDSAKARSLEQSLETVRQHRAAQQHKAALERKLAEPITLGMGVTQRFGNGRIDNATLGDCIRFIADRHELFLLVSTPAFAAVGLDDVQATNASIKPQGREQVPLGDILRKLLDQVDKGDWTATYIVRQDHIEIAPLHKSVRDKKPLTREQLTGLWDDLSNKNATRIRLAAETLGHFPDQAVSLMAERLKPVPLPDPQKVADAVRCLKDLDSAQFAVRQKATDELEKLGSAAIVPLRDRLMQQPSLELRRRVEQLLPKLEPPPTREQLRDVRAIRVLEEIGTPAAEKVLETLAKGQSGAWQTEQAKTALERLRN